MMTTAGVVIWLISAVHYFFINNTGIHPAWYVPFVISCVLSDAAAAVGMAGIEKISAAGESAITKARLHWKDKQT